MANGMLSKLGSLFGSGASPGNSQSPQAIYTNYAAQYGPQQNPSVLGNLAQDALGFLQGVYASPYGTPGFIGGMQNVMHNNNVRSFLRQYEQEEKAKELENAGVFNNALQQQVFSKEGTYYTPEDFSKVAPLFQAADFAHGVNMRANGNVPSFTIAPPEQTAQFMNPYFTRLGEATNYQNRGAAGQAMQSGMAAYGTTPTPYQGVSPLKKGRNGLIAPQMNMQQPMDAGVAPPQTQAPQQGSQPTAIAGANVTSQQPYIPRSPDLMPTDIPPQYAGLAQAGLTSAGQKATLGENIRHNQATEANAIQETGIKQGTLEAQKAGIGYFHKYPPASPIGSLFAGDKNSREEAKADREEAEALFGKNKKTGTIKLPKPGEQGYFENQDLIDRVRTGRRTPTAPSATFGNTGKTNLENITGNAKLNALIQKLNQR